MDCVAHRIRDGVTDTEGFDREGTNLESAAWIEWAQRIGGDLELFQLVRKEPACEGAGVDGHPRELREDVRERADVVLVPVGDEDRLHGTASCAEVADVRNDDVDAKGGLVGEGETTVNEDDGVLVLVEVEVLPDLPHAAERDQAKCWPTRGRLMRATGLLGTPCLSGSACRLRALGHSASPCVLERGRVGTESTSRRVASPAPSRAFALRYSRKAAMSRSKVGRRLPLCSAAAG